jgi:hypothetical protein
MTPLTRWQYAIRSSRLSGLARSVALTLSLRMDSQTVETTMGVDRIAAESGWAKSSVRKAIRELRATGYLWVQFRGSGYRQQSNLYRGQVPRYRGESEEKSERGF